MAQNRVERDIFELNTVSPNLPNEATQKAAAFSRPERWRTITARFFCKDDEHRSRQGKAQKHAWKPFTLCAPLLMSISVVAVSLISIIQILHNKSQRDGGIILAEDLDTIPFSLFFTYQYLPTIIAVGLSIVWGWVDLDTKRLEPYFQLSKPEGAAAEDSILLDYPFELLPVAPFRAAKRRHWAVVCAGTAMMITFWAITPLQSGIFATDTTTRSLSTTMIQSKQLLPSPLNHKFMISAYGISWLGERVPPFTTREYALEPFEPRTPNTSIDFNQYWTSNTTLYSLDLSCHPASFTINKGYIINGWGTANWSTQGNCTMQSPLVCVYPRPGSNFAFYAGSFDNSLSSWHPDNSSCPSLEASSFFVVWTKKYSNTITNATALFCRPRFYLQEVNVTVSATDLSDSKLELSGLRQGLPDTTFNTTNFQSIISVFRRDLPDGDILESDIVEQGPRLANMNSTGTIPRVVEFAVAATQMAPEWYLDPINLSTALEKGYRLLFSLAVNSLMTDVPLQNRQSTGTLSYQVNAVVVVPVFAVIVQAALGLLAVLAMSLLYICWSRTSQLSENPESICSVAALVRQSPEVLQLFENCDALDGKRLNVILRGDTVRFRLTSGPGVKRKTAISLIPNTATRQVHVNGHNAPESVSANPVRSVAMDPWVAAGFILILLLSIAALAFCSMRIRQWNGLPRPSQSNAVRQLLTAYLPTAFATVLEVFWVYLDRLFCVLQPFKEFKRRRATAKSSLEARYTSLPPQLVFLHALRARHFLLAVVCGIANLANVLSIALGGLFKEQFVCIEHEKLFTQSMTPSIHGPIQENFLEHYGIYLDHFYIARANLSDGTPLPPWVSTKQFFVPFEIEVDQDLETNNTYKVMTQGFERELACHPLHEFEGEDTVKFGYRMMDNSETLHIDYTTEDGRMLNCNLPFSGSLDPTCNGPVASERLSHPRDLYGLSGHSQEPFCYTLLVAGWLRAIAEVTSPSRKTYTKGQTVIACEQKMKVAPFYVTVDAAGHVQESTVMGPFKYHTNIDFLDFLTGQPAHDVWHCDTLARVWSSYLLNTLANSSLLTDPRAPAPDPDRAIDLLTDLYQRLTAILLGLHTHALVPAAKNVTIVGSRISQEYRIFMDPTMFWISITILSLDLIVAVAYYYHMRDHFLPRMPTSIASVVGFIYASRALQTDFRDSSAATKSQRFGYGRFIGVDGKAHIGIEMHPFVVPMDCGIPKPPFRKRVTRKLRRSWLSKIMGLAPEGEEETWI